MIQQICNLGNEYNIDTFYKIAIFEASQMRSFTFMTPEDTIKETLTTLPDDSQVLITDLLPNNIKVDHTTKTSNAGKLYASSISFTITPQHKSLQEILETYNNKEVVVLVSKHNTNHLYGTTTQPLLFKYAELNSPDPIAIKGYTITMKGDNYGASKIFEDLLFNIYSRGIAFSLPQSL